VATHLHLAVIEVGCARFVLAVLAALAKLAGKINQQMPYHCLGKVERALNSVGKAPRGSRVAIIGVSYKPGIGDVRESPALKIMDLLAARGADLRYHDPYVPELRGGLELQSVELEAAIEDADVIVIVTLIPSSTRLRWWMGTPRSWTCVA